MFDALVHEHRETKVKTKPLYGESQEVVLGAVTHFQIDFSPDEYHRPDGEPVLRARADLPLHEVWFGAYERRPKAARDADGLELARAAIAGALCEKFDANLFKKYGGSQFEGIVKQLPTLRYLDHVQGLIPWLIAHTRMAGAADFALDSFETVISGLPADKVAECTTQLHEPRLHSEKFLSNSSTQRRLWRKSRKRRANGRTPTNAACSASDVGSMSPSSPIPRRPDAGRRLTLRSP